MVIKIIMVLIFFSVMAGIGLYCRRHTSDVNSFVLGGRLPMEPPISLQLFL